tara:strand:- start:6747 stop:7838 length:1092 start_codon:yes stop_codon:yes gene_type:complete
MIGIEKLYIENFKSYRNYSLSLDNKYKHIVIYGHNGIGKTNLIDSFSFFSNSKGLRGSSLDTILPKNQTSNITTKIRMIVQSDRNILNFSLQINKEDNKFKKTLLLDNKKISLSNIKNYIKIIWLSPYMDKIMYEGQTLKRNFLDKMIMQNDSYFNKIILNNKKDIAERFHILKTIKDTKWLDVIEKKIAKDFYDIFNIRRKYAEEMNSIICSKLKKFREIKIKYKNTFFDDLIDKDRLLDLFINELRKNREIDEITKRTNFSINSDEVNIVDKKNNINIEACSTGEQKITLLTIILANCWKLKKDNSKFILLLDEATSHIDRSNFGKLFDEVDKFDTQIWYTGTNKSLFQVIENKGFFIHLQ